MGTLPRVRNGSETKKNGTQKSKTSPHFICLFDHTTLPRVRNGSETKKEMELRKAKLFLTSYGFSTTPHCQEFETDPRQKKWNSEKQNYSSLHMSFRPHHIANGSRRIRNKKKWNSEMQNYSSLHMSFRPHHIAKSSKRIRNKKKWNSEKQNYSSLHMSFRPHHIAKSSKRTR